MKLSKTSDLSSMFPPMLTAQHCPGAGRHIVIEITKGNASSYAPHRPECPEASGGNGEPTHP